MQGSRKERASQPDRRRLRSGVLYRLITLVAVALSVLCFAGTAAARYEPPPLTGHVVDTLGALSNQERASLERRLSAHRGQHGYVIVVLLTALDDHPIEDVAYEAFNTWGIGDAEHDDGVLLVIAPEERRVRIETGKGVGGELTDLESAEILRDHVIPHLERGDVPAAATQGAMAIAELLVVKGEGRTPGAPRGPPEREFSLYEKIGLGVGLVVIIILAIVSPTFRRILLWALYLFAIFGGRGGGRGGGGGFGGGGGRSGGGGASAGF